MASVNDILATANEKLGNPAPHKSTPRLPLRKVLRPRILVRLLTICCLGCLTGFLAFGTPYWMAAIWTAAATAGMFYETIRFLDQSERKLASFLQALNQNDFSIVFYEDRKAIEYDLHHAFNELSETFKTLRSEKESQHQLLTVIVETAATPMICFEEESGHIHLINNAAKTLFNVPFLQDIKALWKVDAALPNFIREIHDGGKESLKLVLQGKAVFLSVTSQHIIFRNKNLKLIAFHDVTSELASREAETWQKLLRVLTHEIANSAIPLSTLSSYIHELVEKSESGVRELSGEDRKDILVSLKTIEQRSRSLKEFVQNFRSVNHIPEPELKRIDLKELIDEVYALFSQELQNENVRISVKPLPEPCIVYIDKNLTMQVLINLMKNAIESMANYKENKSIALSAEKMSRYINLHVTDTGCGIGAEDLEQIFIPFYSTKKGGSGIGLSISQQIMQKQRGDISVRSIPGKGSVFTLSFWC